jgi:hypothetical protein
MIDERAEVSEMADASTDLDVTGSVPASDDLYVLGRGRFLGRLSRVGIVLIAATAGLFRSAEPAFASVSCLMYKCCCLAYPPGGCPGGNHSNHTCPSGYTKRLWGCCYLGTTQLYACSECTKGSSCWEGPWACSAYWSLGATC